MVHTDGQSHAGSHHRPVERRTGKTDILLFREPKRREVTRGLSVKVFAAWRNAPEGCECTIQEDDDRDPVVKP